MCSNMFVLYIAYMILYCIIQTDCQTIALCSNPIKSGPCSLTCETPGTTQTVDFYLGSTSLGNCFDLAGSPICTAGLSQTGNITTFNIPSLSKTTHEGVWTCRYGAQSSAAETLTVYTEPSVTTFINVSSTTPVSGKKFKIVDLSARSYCFFPAVTSANVQYSLGISGSVISLSTSGVSSGSGTSVGCDAHEFDLQTNVTVNIESSAYTGLSGKSDVYFQITFTSLLGTQYSTDFRLGPYDFEESIGPECPLILYALLPVLFITLIGTIIVIVVACCADKDGKLSESSMEKSCGCCPHKNMFCMAVCPLCTGPWCTGSKKTDSSVIWKNIISVVGFTIVAVIVGLIIAYGLGLDSGKCILALILSIICGLALVAIFTVSVYPHWPCLPEKGNGGLYNLCGR